MIYYLPCDPPNESSCCVFSRFCGIALVSADSSKLGLPSTCNTCSAGRPGLRPHTCLQRMLRLLDIHSTLPLSSHLGCPGSAGLTSKPHRDQPSSTAASAEAIRPYVDCFACDWHQLAQMRTSALNHGPSRTPVKRYLVTGRPNALGRAATVTTASTSIPICPNARAASRTVEPVVMMSSNNT